MRVQVKPSRVLQSTWVEFLVRFVFGGLVTAITGLVAKQFGPGVAGLFLAFPAILPASITLVQRHEEKKQKSERMEEAKNKAGEDSLGAAIGSFGLVVFGVILWQFGTRGSIAVVLIAAFVGWLATAVLAWAAVCFVTGRMSGDPEEAHSECAPSPKSKSQSSPRASSPAK